MSYSYPSLPHDVVSTRQPVSGLVIDIAGSGRPRSRSLYSYSVYRLRIVHTGLAETDKDSVLTHYAANKGEEFGYIWPDGSVTMWCVYDDAPSVEWTPGGWNLDVSMMGRDA